MAEIKWIKLTTNMFDNRKIKHLRKLPDGNNIVLIWVMLLTMAGRCNAGGMIFLTENIPYTTKMLADELDFEESVVILALKALEQLDMIIVNGDFFAIAGWEEYQNIDGMEKVREQNRIRQKKWYDNQKQIPNVIPNVTVTQPNATDIDKDIDIEIDKDINTSTKKRKKKQEEPKKVFGELGNVKLTQAEYDKLCERYGEIEAGKAISYLDKYIPEKKYKSESHYLTILRWVMDAVSKQEAKQASSKGIDWANV